MLMATGRRKSKLKTDSRKNSTVVHSNVKNHRISSGKQGKPNILYPNNCAVSLFPCKFIICIANLVRKKKGGIRLGKDCS